VYSADDVQRFYDRLGEAEWERFGKTPADRVSLEIHRRFLAEHVEPGMRVLDAGAGPGRFTIELARLGATVVVGDVSPVQLRLNEEKLLEAGLESAVEARHVLDITDLSRFRDGEFEAVVCYGGPLSYVWERAGDAAVELLRVTGPGGRLLASVMSNLGTHRRWLNDAMAIAERHGIEAIDRVFRTGGLPAEINTNPGHACRMFRYAELEALLERAGWGVADASASSFLTARLEPIEPMSEALWEMLLAWELDACREPGALDGGTHIIVAARRSDGERGAD
jgi:SAM-dependent methyltransferase